MSEIRTSARTPKLTLSKVKDAVMEKIVFILAALSAAIIVIVFIFIFMKSARIFSVNGLSFFTTKNFDQQILKAFNAPADKPVWDFGVLGLIAGTFLTTFGAMIIAVIAGVTTAIVIAELAPPWMKRVLQTVIRLLASIPSIIYGLIGLMVVVPFIKSSLITNQMQINFIKYFQLSGNSMLAGIIVLSIMVLPIVVALSVDAINAVPKKHREAALALGLSKWRTIVKVVIPAAKSGIIASVILATGRAIGEAIALSMVSGGVGNIPNLANGPVFFLTPVLTLASAIVNKSETMSFETIQSALFACGVVLLIMSTILSVFTKVVQNFVKRREGNV